MICNEIFDEFSHPSNEEIHDYAIRIGIDPESEPQLMHLAREGLMEALPSNWKPCFDLRSQTYYYYNTENGKSQWDHPLDVVYQKKVSEERSKYLETNVAVIETGVKRIESENGHENENNDGSTATTTTTESYKLDADGAKFLKNSSSAMSLKSILRPNFDEHVDDEKKIVRFDLTKNFRAISEVFDDDDDEEEVESANHNAHDNDNCAQDIGTDDRNENHRTDAESEQELDNEIGAINAKRVAVVDRKTDLELFKVKLLNLSDNRTRFSVSPVSFDDSESNRFNTTKTRGRFSISPVSLNDDNKDDNRLKVVTGITNQPSSGSSEINKCANDEHETKLHCRTKELDEIYEKKWLKIKAAKELEFLKRISDFEEQLKGRYETHCRQIEENFSNSNDRTNLTKCQSVENIENNENADDDNNGKLSPTIAKCEEIIDKVYQEKESLEKKYLVLKEKYVRLKMKIRTSIENRKMRKALFNSTNTEEKLKSCDKTNTLSYSSVENLRKQLKRLDDLEEQLPSVGYDEKGYKVQYPFKNTATLNSTNLANELGFFRHRIHLERDCIRRAKASLKAQQLMFQQQKQLIANDPKEYMDLEISLHRTRNALGEKIIRLRHLERSYANLLRPKSKDLSDECSTLSEISSCNSASSGFSSIELNVNEVNAVSSSQSQSQSQSQTSSQRQQEHNVVVSGEMMRTLEKLNREIHEIWDVLLLQQRPDADCQPLQAQRSSAQKRPKKSLRQWFNQKSTK